MFHMLSPRETGKFVSNVAQDVTIDTVSIESAPINVCAGLKEIHSNWHNFPGHPPVDHPRLIDYIFLMDSLNFSFWSDEPCTVEGKRGYSGFVMALSRNPEIWNPLVYGDMSMMQVEELLATDQGKCLPMCKERWEIMTENARILRESFDGSAINILERGNYDAVQIVNVITHSFPSFDDTASYNGHRVSFYKRAQIFVADVYSAVGRKNYITNMHKLTMFADYRVPQVLLSMSILSYSTRLHDVISERLLESGEPMEVEIRAASIEAVELLAKRFNVSPFAVDYALWDYAGEHWEQVNKFPVHRIRTIFY